MLRVQHTDISHQGGIVMKSDDLFQQWLHARRRQRAMQPLERRRLRGASPWSRRRPPGRPRAFWSAVSSLLWLSHVQLRLVARLYFLGLLSPRVTRALLRISGRPAEAALTLMRNRSRYRPSRTGRCRDDDPS
jgi:hypothetical protein